MDGFDSFKFMNIKAVDNSMGKNENIYIHICMYIFHLVVGILDFFVDCLIYLFGYFLYIHLLLPIDVMSPWSLAKIAWQKKFQLFDSSKHVF